MGNLGHSIVKQKGDRIYIEKGNKISLGAVSYFTFEPHISVQDSKYGYKKENIYYFDNGVIKELWFIFIGFSNTVLFENRISYDVVGILHR